MFELFQQVLGHSSRIVGKTLTPEVRRSLISARHAFESIRLFGGQFRVVCMLVPFERSACKFRFEFARGAIFRLARVVRRLLDRDRFVWLVFVSATRRHNSNSNSNRNNTDRPKSKIPRAANRKATRFGVELGRPHSSTRASCRERETNYKTRDFH